MTISFDACCETSVQIGRDFVTRYFALTDQYEALREAKGAPQTPSMIWTVIALAIMVFVLLQIIKSVDDWRRNRRAIVGMVPLRPVISGSGALARDRIKVAVESDKSIKMFDEDDYRIKFEAEFKHMRRPDVIKQDLIIDVEDGE